MSLKKVKNINPSELNDIKSLQKLLLNAVEELSRENELLKEENSRLRDENARLKGGNARPVFTNKKKSNRDISSGGKEKGRRNARGIKTRKPRVIAIDKEIKVDIDRKHLPSDAVFKGYSNYVQQDLKLQRDNKRFLLATYYSSRENKTYGHL